MYSPALSTISTAHSLAAQALLIKCLEISQLNYMYICGKRLIVTQIPDTYVAINVGEAMANAVLISDKSLKDSMVKCSLA